MSTIPNETDVNETFTVDQSALKNAQVEDDHQDDCWVEQRKNLGNMFAAVQTSTKLGSKKAVMQVYVRVRPTKNPPSEDIRILEPLKKSIGEKGSVTQYPTRIQTSSKQFEFTGIFPSCSSQDDVYQSTVNGYIDGLQSGKSALVFCYGRTNTGKTHTVTGTLEDPMQWGLIPRALEKLLPSSISYFEIYNEQIYDLLGNMSPGDKSSTLNSDPLLRNITSLSIATMDSAMQAIRAAHQARRSASNNVNARSSRSHALCRIQLANGAVLWIVDLAGSEKAMPGVRLKESININKSLSALNRCFLALQNQQPLPYRDSKLTRILGQHWKSSYASRTTLIVNLTLDDAAAASQVLEYASIAAKAQAAPTRQNTAAGVSYDLNGRRRIVRSIKQVMQMLSPRRKVQHPKPVVEPQSEKKMIHSELSDDDGDAQSAASSPGDKNRIDDLMEVVQDCEEEMARMRETHLEQIEQLKTKYEAKLQQEREEAAAELARMQEELADRDDDILTLKEEKDELEAGLMKMTEENNLLQEELGIRDEQLEGMRQEMIDFKFQKTDLDASTESEMLSCDDVMAQKENVVDVTGSIARVSNTSSPDGESEGSFGEEIQSNTIPLFKSARKVRCDPFTGKYLRPRGRAPSGALSWDEDRGAWRMSVL